MTKGGKRYLNMEHDGNWFAHAGLPPTETERDSSTSTGSMLAEVVPPPLAPNMERYPKIFINPKQKTLGRDYPFSSHDNRATLQDSIDAFDDGLGRQKCLDERRQHNSHFCLCHRGGVSAAGGRRGDFSAYQTDFLPSQETEGGRSSRFPRSHLERSRAASAAAQAEECTMWFGRHDSDRSLPLHVLAATNCSSSQPRYSHHRKH